MARRCLVSIFAPSNLLAAFAAVRWQGCFEYGDRGADITLLLHVPGWSDELTIETAAVVRQIVGSHLGCRLITLSGPQMDRIVGPDSSIASPQVLENFRNAIGASEFDEVYYTHDVVGHAAQLCMRAYPSAARLTFGDALGCMYNKQYHLALATGKGWDPNREGSEIVGEDFEAKRAVLILPMDQTGDSLRNKELLVVPHVFVTQVLKELQSGLQPIEEYSRELLFDRPRPCYLFLTETMSEAGFISLENELNLYEEIILEHAAPGSTVLIKRHPLGAVATEEMLVNRLANRNVTCQISPLFLRYPLELWSYLVQETVPIGFSYATLSLRYLYNKETIYALSPERIEKYFPQRMWHSYKNGDVILREQLSRLTTWDGLGVLWAGNYQTGI